MKRFLLYALVYVLVTVGSIFGTVTVGNLFMQSHIETSISDNSNQSEPSEPSDGEKLLNNLLSIKSTDVDLELNIANSEQTTLFSNDTEANGNINVKFNGKLSIADLSNIKVAGTMLAIIDGINVKIDLAYFDNTIYISNESMNIKLQSASISKIMELLPSLGINLDLGIDLASIDTSEILNNLQTAKAVAQENGDLLLPLKIIDGISFNIISDKNYNVKTVSANSLRFKDKVANLSAKLDSEDDQLVIKDPEEDKAYVDVTKTLSIVDSIREVLTNKKLHLNVDADFVGNISANLNGSVDVDFSKNLNLFSSFNANINESELNVNFGYINEKIYLGINNLKFATTKNNLEKTISLISKYFNFDDLKQSTLLDMAKAIPGFELSKLTQLKFSDININNLIEFSNGQDGEIKIIVLGKSLGLENDLLILIHLDENDQFKNLSLSNIKIFDGTLSANVCYSEEVSLPQENELSYLDLCNLDKFTEALLATVNQVKNEKYISFNLNALAKINDENVNIEGNIDIDFATSDTLKMYANLSALYRNKRIDIKLSLQDKVVYASVDNLKFKIELDNLNAVFDKMNMQSKDLLKAIVNKVPLINDVLNGNFKNLPTNIISNFVTGDNSIQLEFDKSLINANETIKIILHYDQKIDLISANLKTDDFATDITLQLNNQKNSFEIAKNEYVSLDNLKEFIPAITETINGILENRTVEFNINANVLYKDMPISIIGECSLKENLIYSNLQVTIFEKDIKVELFIKDNVVYASAGGTKVRLSINELQALINKYAGKFDIEELIEKLLPQLNLSQIKGGDLSGINIDIIKDIKLSNNNAKITISKDHIILDDDLIVSLDYNTLICSLNILNIQKDNISGEIDLQLKNNITVPELQIDEYNDICELDKLVSAITELITKVKTEKQIALDLNLDLEYKQESYNLSGTTFVNFKNVKADALIKDIYVLADLSLKHENDIYSVKLLLDNGWAYINFKNLNVKIYVDNITDLYQTVSDLLNAEINIKDYVDIDNSILMQAINGNYEKITQDLIKSIVCKDCALKLSLSKDILSSDNDFDIEMKFDEKIESVSIKDIQLNNIKASLDAKLKYDFKMPEIDKTRYQDISGINYAVKSIIKTINTIKENKSVGIKLTNAAIGLNDSKLNVNGTIYVQTNNSFSLDNFDLKNVNLFIELSILQNDYIHNIKALFDGENIYLTYNNLNFFISINNLKDAIDTIKLLKNISEKLKTADLSNVSIEKIIEDAKNNSSDTDYNQILKRFSNGSPFEKMMNGEFSDLDISMIKSIEILRNGINAKISKDLLSSKNDILISANYTDVINDVSVNNLLFNNIEFGGTLSLLLDYKMPTIEDLSIYTSLNEFNCAVNSALTTATDVVDNKHIAFKLQTEFTNVKLTKDKNDTTIKSTETYVKLLPSSIAKFDWNDAYEYDGTTNKFIFTKMKAYINFNVVTTTNTYEFVNGVKNNNPVRSITNNHAIEILYLDNVVYIRYNQMRIKINGESVSSIIKTICEILGIDVNDNTLDNIKDLIGKTSDKSAIESIIKKFKVEMIKSLTLNDNQFKIVADLTDLGLGIDALNELKLDVNYSQDSLNRLLLKDIKVLNNNISSIQVDLFKFTEISQGLTGDYIDLSDIKDMLVAVKNSMDYKDIEINGSIKLKLNVIGIDIDWDIPMNLKVKIYQDNSYEVQIKLGAIPVITGVNDDAPYKFGNTVSGIYPGLDRILNVYIKDNMVYMHRTEKVPVFPTGSRKYEKKLKIHIETLLDDPLYYILQYGMGFSNKIKTAIDEAINKERINPIDYSNVLKGFSADANNYVLTLNLKELTENDKLDTMSLGIKTVKHNNRDIIGGITFNMFMPVASNVEITLKSDNLTHVNIGQTLDMSVVKLFASFYKYDEGAEWDAYDDDWQLSGQRKFKLSFETNCNVSLNAIEGIAGTKIDLPILNDYSVNSDVDYRTYKFVGWYTSKTLEEDTLYTENIIPRKDTTLYAKWTEEVLKYVTISFNANGGEEKPSIKALEGTTIVLPTYVEPLIISDDNTITTKEFNGWYIDKDCLVPFNSTVAPTEDITLYAKWSIVDCSSMYNLTIYDGNEKIYSKYLAEDSLLQLTGEKYTTTTKYYLDANFTNNISDISAFTMPSEDTAIYIRNIYNVKIVSVSGNVLNEIYDLYQGEKVSIKAQSSSEYDTYENGKKSKRIYNIFKGYYANGVKIENIENYVMPNYAVEIVALWENSSKNYYTVTLSKDNSVGNIAYEKYISFPKESVQVLEGETLVLDSSYTPTWKYKFISNWHYEFKGWSLSKTGSTFTQLTITGDTTIYAIWSSTPKKG